MEVDKQAANGPDQTSTPDDIVITGMSGTFPSSHTIDEFEYKLYNKIDMVEKETRFDFAYVDQPERGGIVPETNKFDCGYFGVHERQAEFMDPAIRMTLEKCTEAILDAGLHPEDLKNTRTGVYLGSCVSESQIIFGRQRRPEKSFYFTGNMPHSAPNRISYFFNLKGPSMTVDTACSSSLFGLEHAYSAMRKGEIESAIVVGSNLCTIPGTTIQFKWLGVLSADGTCKVFDEKANGYVRAEGICVLLLQKRKHAKRIYCSVVHAKTNSDGYKDEGITYPSMEGQSKLLEEFYSECRIPPINLSYLEAHGTALCTTPWPFISLPELSTLFTTISTAIFQGLEKRCDLEEDCNFEHFVSLSPNFVSSVSVMTGISGATETTRLNTPKPLLRVYVNTFMLFYLDHEIMEIEKSFTKSSASNSKMNRSNFSDFLELELGFPNFLEIQSVQNLPIHHLRTEDLTGTKVGDPEECYAIDQIFTKNRDNPLLIGSVKSSVGHSEPVSGSMSVVKSILALEKGKISPNLHFHSPNPKIPSIIEGRLKVVTDVTNFQDDRALIGINNFGFGGANCHVLIKGDTNPKKNHGVPQDDLPRLVCLSGRTEDSIIALCDYITEIGVDAEFIGLLHNIFRKNIINHMYRGYIIISKDGVVDISNNSEKYASWKIPTLIAVFGELENWYSLLGNFLGTKIFRDTLNRIEKILAPMSLEYTVLSTSLEIRKSYKILGSIIAQICLADLLIQLKISPNFTAGYSYGELVCAYFDGALKLEEVLECASTLNSEFVMKMELRHKNKDHMDGNEEFPLGKRLTEKISVVLSKPNYRRKQVSAEFFADVLSKNNANKSKDFNKSNSLILEIGKNDIDILRDNFENTQWMVIPEEFIDFLKTVGRLYQLGYNPAIEKLYPAVKFPVSKGTPRLSSKIKWMHHRTYDFIYQNPTLFHHKSFTIDLRKTDCSYISGHMIDGRILFPASGYLILTWEALAENYKVQDSLPVIFEDVRFIRATTIQPSNPVNFDVVISNSGYFEITEKNSVVVNGHIKEVLNEEKVYDKFEIPVESEHIMTTKDIYQELRLRGYFYQGQFRAMKTCDITGRKAEIECTNNYITFIDTLFQLQILGHDTRLLYVPTHIAKLTILPTLHHKFMKSQDNQGDSVTLSAYSYPHSRILRSGGIEVQGLLATPIPRRKELSSPILEVNEFVPNETELSKQLSVRVNLQIIIENSPVSKFLPSLEIVDLDPTNNAEPGSQLLTPAIIEALEDVPFVQPNAKVFSSAPISIKDVVVVNNGNLRNEAGVYMLIIGTKLLEKKEVLEDVLYALQNNGYIISREHKNFSADDFNYSNLILLTVHRNEEETVVMMSKTYEKVPVFMKLDEDSKFSWLPKLQSILKSEFDVVLYSQHNRLSGITGFFNCLQRERGVKSVRAVLILDEDKYFNPSETIFVEQLRKNLTVNIYKNGQWGTYRHLPINSKEEKESRHIFLGQLTTGDLSSLKWMQGPLDNVNIAELSSDEELVEVFYSSLNFKDIMVASGKITADSVFGYSRNQLCDLGFEFAGINQNGKRIMGLSALGALGTRVISKDFSSWEIPEDWSMEAAATVPVVYATMLYGLRLRCNMKKGESILIHSGLGGVGQAAIRYCLFHGLTVYTTVGNDERKEVLKKLYPQLTDIHIGNSHDTSFQQLIMKETKGRGVDLVLNSLAGEKLLSSVQCLAQGGRMIEIGKYDIRNNNMLNLNLFKKGASFHGVMLDMFFNSPSELTKIGKLLIEGIEEGSIKPLPRNVFKFNEIEQAFRHMAGGNHLGKVVIQIREETEAGNKQLKSQRFTGIPRFHCDPKKSYIIVGGLGGFGLELADWLVLRGARKLVLSSSRGFSNGYQRMRVNVWKSYGTIVQITTLDLSTKPGCIQLIQEANKLGPIDGIFNLAVCLKDALFENQTIDMYKESLTPKAYITKHLDELTRKICPNLRAFVVFSSVSCGRGNAGQTNYGMANSIMERICEARQREGYAGKAIQWGAVGEVGILRDMTENNATEINIGGTLLQKISNCLQVLDILLLNSSPIVSSIVVAEKTRGSYSTENAVEAVASIIGITDLKSVSFHSTLSEIGMDSMTAVEIKQVLEVEFDIFLSPKEMKTLTLAKLQEIQDSMGSGQTSAENGGVSDNETTLILYQRVAEESESRILEVRMNSKIAGNENAPTIVVIPGLEGFMKGMEPLCENLEAYVHGLQFNYAEAPETILDMAKMKLPIAEKYLSKNKPFQIIAYSYGVVEALEIVGLLEAKGYYGSVYCIDGAPAVMHYFSKNVLGKTVDDNESNFLLELLKSYNVPLSGLQKMALDFRKCKSIEEKVEKTIEVYGNQVPISKEYMETLIKGTTKRVLALVAYKPSYITLKSRLVLFKPSLPTFPHRFEDFGLKEICKEPVLVHTIEGNHNTILLNYELSKYINSYL